MCLIVSCFSGNQAQLGYPGVVAYHMTTEPSATTAKDTVIDTSPHVSGPLPISASLTTLVVSTDFEKNKLKQKNGVRVNDQTQPDRDGFTRQTRNCPCWALLETPLIPTTTTIILLAISNPTYDQHVLEFCRIPQERDTQGSF